MSIADVVGYALSTFVAGLFVCSVYLVKYVIARFLEHK